MPLAIDKSAAGALDTLRYLAKSGRVPLVMHWATSLLQIKPIFAAKGEEVRALERVRAMMQDLTGTEEVETPHDDMP